MKKEKIISGLQIVMKADKTVRLKQENGMLTMAANGPTASFAARVPMDSEAALDVVVNGKMLSALLARSGDEVSLQKDGADLALTSGNCRVGLPLLSNQVLIPEPDSEEHQVVIPGDLLLRYAAAVSHALGNPFSDQLMRCVSVEFDDENLRVTALDGRRISRRERQPFTPGAETKSMVVHGEMLATISSCFKGDVKVRKPADQSHVQFANESLICNIQVMDRDFYHLDLFQKIQAKTEVFFDADEMRAVLETAKLLTASSAGGPITFRLHGKTVEYRTTNSNGSMSGSMSGQVMGAATEITMNVDYLLEAIRSMTAATILMQISSPSAPVLLTGSPDEWEIICPIRPY